MWFPLGRFDQILKCSAFLAFQQIDDNRLLGFAFRASTSRSSTTRESDPENGFTSPAVAGAIEASHFSAVVSSAGQPGCRQRRIRDHAFFAP